MDLLTELEELLIDSKIYYSRNSEELNLRCCYCGDSTKSQLSKHMYVGIKDSLPVYYCQRCHSKGILNLNFLLTHHFNPSRIGKVLKQVPKTTTTKYKYKKLNEKIFLKVFNNLPKKKQIYDIKIEYFEKRTGINFLENKNWHKYKIILSIKQFLKDNIDYLKTENSKFFIQDNFIDLLDNNYIGFLSNDNSTITFRCVKKDSKFKRFYNITLKHLETPNFYAFKQKIPGDKFNIILCEGIFDGIVLSKRLQNDNNIYISVLNKDYQNKISYLIERFGTKINSFEIYLDQDHTYLRQFQKSEFIKLYKNQAEKDYGEITEKFIPKRIFVN